MNRKLVSLLRRGLLPLFAVALADQVSGQATLINVDSGQSAALVQALQAKGLTASTGAPGGPIAPSTRLVVWEAREGGADLSAESARQIAEYVRLGGNLLLGLGERTGLGPMRLAFMLPTIPWRTQQANNTGAAPHGEVSAFKWDAALFPHNEPAGLTLPYRFEIAPASAVEAGMGRYDRFSYRLPHFDLKHEPGEFFWSRPLLNRDWTVRIRGTDGAEDALLITGRYGAGRVAVLASAVTGNAAPLRKMYDSLVDWLVAPQPAALASHPLELKVAAAPAVDPAGKKSLAVTIHNPGSVVGNGTVLARFLTWEDALAGDGQLTFTVAPGAQTTVFLPFPGTGPTGYEALDFQDAYDVRVGLLSADQTTLLAETRQLVNLEPAVDLSLATDNLLAVTYPFHAPGTDGLPLLRGRMGMPIMDYAYKPGQTVHASVSLSGGLRNLALRSEVEDETQPGNVTAAALILNNGQYDKPSRGEFGANCAWVGKEGVENVVKFTFPQPVSVGAVVLNGCPTDFRQGWRHNPGAIVVECDGKQVASEAHLDPRFVSEFGLVRIAFPVAQGRVIRVRLPWSSEPVDGKPRLEPRLGGVLIEGATGELPAAQQGVVSLTLHDSLTGNDLALGQQPAAVTPGTTKVVPFSFTLPAGAATSFYQLQATFQGLKKTVPILATNPVKTLLPREEAAPEGAMGMNFVVTGGFRNGAGIGTGTQEPHVAWASPDDLVWAFSRGLKQTGGGRAMPAGMLFSMNDGISHYGNPWTAYRNGEMFFSVAAPQYLKELKKRRDWATNPNVQFGFSDRWDSGPSLSSMYTWQDFVAFDQYLRSQGKPGLKGQTHTEIAREIDHDLSGPWQKWQTSRYVEDVETLRKTFADEGKRFGFSGQGIPIAAADAGKIVSQTVRGMSDDNTWGMWDNDITLTAGRQLAYLAYNPWWGLLYNFPWGWNSSTLNNAYWFAPVGTTEPSRRHQAERSWRATIDGDGAYRSMFTYGYGANGGVSYCMNDNDWQQLWLAQERQSLIYPDGPIGAGLIVGTGVMENPDTALFSGGGMGDSPAERIVTTSLAPIFAKLQRAGLSIPFAASVSAVSHWKGHAPLIVNDLSVLTPEEIAMLKKFLDDGVPIAAFRGAAPLSEGAATLFGVHRDGTLAGGEKVGQLSGGAIYARGPAMLVEADGHALETDDMRTVASLISAHLQLPIKFPEGTTGYGFTEGNLRYLVVEDWLDEGRVVTVRLRAGAGRTAHAVNVNDHAALSVHRDKDDWVIDLPLRPGDGALIALSEVL